MVNRTEDLFDRKGFADANQMAVGVIVFSERTNHMLVPATISDPARIAPHITAT